MSNYSKLVLSSFFKLFGIPFVVLSTLYYVYDFSLNSVVTAVIYSVLALGCLLAVIVTFKLNKTALRGMATVAITYLSVYLVALKMNLNTTPMEYLKGVIFTVLAIAFITFFRCVLLPKKDCAFYTLRKVLFVIIAFITLFLPLLLLCYLIATNSLISSDIIIALAQTNGAEGAEFFVSNVNYKWLLALLFLIAVIYINCKAYENLTCDPKAKVTTSFSIAIILIGSIFLAIPRIDYLPFAVVKVTSRQLDNFALYKQQKGVRLQKLSTLTSLKLNPDVDKDGNLFVLVIGESQSASHIQAYGYQKATTPKLVERLKEPNHLLFNNVFSSWPQTVQALSYALTNANQYNQVEVSDAYSLIEIARAVGFDTYWLSNQRKYGMYETPITVISSTANHEIWTNGSAKMEGVFFDEELVNRLPKVDPNKNTLIIIHLMGSHQKYEKRVPKEFRQFTGADEVVASYDNSILYTDYVVDEIYNKAKKNPAFKALVYFSDHGEEPHVVGGHDPVNVTYQMLKVPLFVYLSDSYRKNHLNLFESLKSNEHKYFSNDLIFDLMVSLMRIEGVPNFEESLNLSSKKYRLDKASTLTMYGKKHINEFSEEKN
ncbi:MAG: phosphoethanolamine transferase [Succinivibrio sp.]|nr:phosphoethanolamine transferase [Succinivibrio sp.]MCI6449879.1 phosphoethanolamine transferase [Succinivibrio sp.]MDD6068054.1 phosphoethanolamine transferase [Succinivibrio sp.]MDD7286885.1 phosphoethanolamine transferase [Succinivibrio sp.]MDY3108479.1 phosphoethanolamine transferase [Succinivibrio sp.]